MRIVCCPSGGAASGHFDEEGSAMVAWRRDGVQGDGYWLQSTMHFCLRLFDVFLCRCFAFSY